MDQFSDLLQELQGGDSGGKFLNFDTPMGVTTVQMTPWLLFRLGRSLSLSTMFHVFVNARLGKPKFVCVLQMSVVLEVTRGMKCWRQPFRGHAVCLWEAVQD